MKFSIFFCILFSTFRISLPSPQSYKIAAACEEGSANMSHSEVLKSVSRIIPALSASLHKGSCGRVAIVGGSYEYCGAPYYAAITSLRVGSDLSFVFCTQAAAMPIKSYSPEFMVLPCLDSKKELDKGLERLDGIHTLVIGPGLGRDKEVFNSALALITAAKHKNKSIILDGDALFLLSVNEELRNFISGYDKICLTPNKVEFQRIFDAVMGKTNEEKKLKRHDNSTTEREKYFFNTEETDAVAADSTHEANKVVRLARSLGGVTILEKGSTDFISDGKTLLMNDKFGSNRRCGGQGDVLAGSFGVFLAWKDIIAEGRVEPTINADKVQIEASDSVLGAFAASCLVRRANQRAFEKRKRSMVTPDVIEEIGETFEELFSSL